MRLEHDSPSPVYLWSLIAVCELLLHNAQCFTQCSRLVLVWFCCSLWDDVDTGVSVRSHRGCRHSACDLTRIVEAKGKTVICVAVCVAVLDHLSPTVTLSFSPFPILFSHSHTYQNTCYSNLLSTSHPLFLSICTSCLVFFLPYASNRMSSGQVLCYIH